MTGTLLAQPVNRALGPNGAPVSGAQMRFLITGTTTPTPAYTATDLGTPLSNPVVADSGGLFPVVYLDPAVIYRVQLLDGAGGLIRDVDPVNALIFNGPGSITAGMLQSGSVLANIGFTPLNRAGDLATNLALAFTAPSATSAGYLGAPRNEQDTNYTFTLSDCGRMVRCSSSAAVSYVLQPQSLAPWPDGAMIVVRNAGAGVLTIQRGAGVILLPAGTNTNKDCVIAPYGLGTLLHDYPNDSWTISGVGVS